MPGPSLRAASTPAVPRAELAEAVKIACTRAVYRLAPRRLLSAASPPSSCPLPALTAKFAHARHRAPFSSAAAWQTRIPLKGERIDRMRKSNQVLQTFEAAGDGAVPLPVGELSPLPCSYQGTV